MEVVVGRCFEKRSGEFLVWMSVQIVCIELVSTKLNLQLSLAKINSTEPSNILSPILSRYSCFLAIHHIEDAGNGLFVVLKLTWKVLLTTLLNSIGGTRVSTLNGVLGECSDRGSIYIYFEWSPLIQTPLIAEKQGSLTLNFLLAWSSGLKPPWAIKDGGQHLWKFWKIIKSDNNLFLGEIF